MSKANEKQRRSPKICVGRSAKTIFGLACIEKKVSLLVGFFAYLKILFKNVFFCNRILELSKANEKQSRSPIFCLGRSAKTIFGLACIEKKLVS